VQIDGSSMMYTVHSVQYEGLTQFHSRLKPEWKGKQTAGYQRKLGEGNRVCLSAISDGRAANASERRPAVEELVLFGKITYSKINYNHQCPKVRYL